MENKLTFDEWLEKTYPKNMVITEYVHDFFDEGDKNLSLDEIEEFIKKVRNYFEKRNIQYEPKVNIWSLPGRDEDEDSVPSFSVYYNRLETDEEYEERLRNNPHKYITEYERYEEEWEKEQIRKTEEYKTYLKLKEKFKNI